MLTVNVADAAIRSAVDGVGVTCVLSYQVAEHLASGALVRILAQHEPPLPVQVVYPATSARTAKVRAFVDLAAPPCASCSALPIGDLYVVERIGFRGRRQTVAGICPMPHT